MLAQRLGILVLVLNAYCLTQVSAGEVPLPVKKPRDAQGKVVTKPVPEVVPAAKPATPANPAPQGPASKLTKDNPKVTAPAAAPAAAAAGPAKPGIPVKATEPPKELTEWAPEEIAAAKARCTEVMKGVAAVAIPEPPMRKGSCGAPAPLKLLSIGSKPEVTLDPPAVLTCDMVAMLSTWVKGDLQPLARKHLGSEIVKIETMSDYSCRNAYGRIGNKLSEHGKANALDIRGFVTAKAEPAMVLEGWGPTQRDIAAAKAAAEKKAAEIKAAAEKLAAEQAAKEAAAKAATAGAKPPPAGKAPDATAAPHNLVTRSTIIDGVPEGFLPKSAVPSGATGLGFAPAQRLGGPKENDAAPGTVILAASDSSQKKKQIKPKEQTEAKAAIDNAPSLARSETRLARFLHDAHASACRLFGTTLGPEANNAHRNHFHVDMAPRKLKKICD